MKIGLLICPFYSGGTSVPLGLSYINKVLKEQKHETFPCDIEYLLNKENPIFIQTINRIFGYPAHDPTKIMFVIRPELLFYALFPNEYENYYINVNEYEKRFIYILKEKLNEIIEKIIKEPLDIIMFSVYVSNLAISLITAQLIKKKMSIPIIFGGPGVSIPEVYKLILKMDLIDGVVVGEGENTISEIVYKYASSGHFVRAPGFVTERTLDQFSPRELIQNLDSIPHPEFRGFPFKGYNLRSYLLGGKNTFIPVATSRGCIMKCSFCSESQFWKTFRLRSVKSVIDEIEYQINKHKIFNIRFNDSLTNPDILWLEHLCEVIIDRKININWVFSYFRPYGINENLATKLRRAGCKYIALGVESGSSSIRKKMKKGTENENILRYLKILNNAGITTMVTILSGFPNETNNEFIENINLFKEWINYSRGRNTNIHWIPAGLVRIEPYSDIYKNHERYGITIVPYSIELPENLAYLKEDISKILLAWEDKIKLKERLLRDFIIKNCFFSCQPNILNKIDKHQDVTSNIIEDSIMIQVVQHPSIEIVKKNDNCYLLLNKDKVLLEMDKKIFDLYTYLKRAPRTFVEICQQFGSSINSRLIREEIKTYILLFVNMKPNPLLKIIESEDMRK